MSCISCIIILNNRTPGPGQFQRIYIIYTKYTHLNPRTVKLGELEKNYQEVKSCVKKHQCTTWYLNQQFQDPLI